MCACECTRLRSRSGARLRSTPPPVASKARPAHDPRTLTQAFYDWLDLERSVWNDRVFSILGAAPRGAVELSGIMTPSVLPSTTEFPPPPDEDNSGGIDFREFVVGVWNYAAFDKLALATFAVRSAAAGASLPRLAVLNHHPSLRAVNGSSTCSI